MLGLLKNLRLGVKVALLGVSSVLITAAGLVTLAVWQSGQYHTLAQGEVDQLIDADLDHIMQGIYNLVRTENEAVQQQINYNLNVAQHVLRNLGDVSLSSETVAWTATDQFTGQTSRIQLPKMLAGGRWLGQNADPSVETAMVDEVTQMVGETATIFQRMNERGDMLRVATSVQTAEGRRAIGTYIPAVQPDGTPNPVIASILKGETYRGRAFVVNTWHLAAYEAIKDGTGNLLGMLYVGLKQSTVESRVRQAFLETRVGKTGYVFALSAQGENRGRYVISQGGQRDGEDIWASKDSDGHYVVQSIINRALGLKAGELGTERYRWQNPGEPAPRWKIARLVYFAPWDWVIGTSAYEDELQYYRAILNDGRVRMTHAMTTAGLGISLCVAFLGTMIASTIARPLGRVTRDMETIIRTHLHKTVEVRVRDEIGTLAETFNFMVDELKQTMQGLRNSEDRFRAMVERSPLAIVVVTGPEQTITYVNSRASQLLGYAVSDVATLAEWWPLAYPDETYRRSVRTEWERRIVASPETSSLIAPMESLVTCKDGSRKIVEWGIVSLTNERIIYGLDLTERKQAEEALRESETRLRGIVRAVPAAIGMVSADRKMEFVNDQMRELVGYTPEEIIGHNTSMLYVDEEEYLRVGRDLYQDLWREGPTQTEGRVRHKNGQEVHVLINAAPLRPDDPSAGAIVTLLDITQRKRAEMELLREKQFTEKLLESLPGIFFLYDSTCHLKRWNKAHETATGFTADELRDWYIPDWHETPEEAAVGMALVKSVLETGVGGSFETTLINKQGRFIPYLISITRLMAPDGPAMMGVGIDISERKRTDMELLREKQFSEKLLESLPGIFFLYDSTCHLKRWNKAHETATGFTADELRDWYIPDWHETPEEAAVGMALVKSVLETGVGGSFETTLINKQGRFVPYLISITRLMTPDGPAMMGIGIDITARKQAEEQLRQQMKEIERFNLLAVERETRVIELKRRINELVAATGAAPPYDLTQVDAVAPEITSGGVAKQTPERKEGSTDDRELTGLFDSEAMRRLLDSFSNSVGMAAAILDLSGTVLVASGWLPICTDFHRANEATRARCVESDTVLAGQLREGEGVSFYRCRNGLTDAASPVLIEGRHVANVFIGQFLLEPADEAYFRRQATEFGFDEAAYLEASRHVPLVSRERLNAVLMLLKGCAEMVGAAAVEHLRGRVAESTLGRRADELDRLNRELLRQRAAAISLAEDANEARATAESIQRELCESERKTRAIFDLSFGFIGLLTPAGLMIEANRSSLDFTGIELQDVVGRPFWETPWWTHSTEAQERIRAAVHAAASGELVRYEDAIRAADGSLHTIDFSLKPVRDDTGRIAMLIPEGRDITQRKQYEAQLVETRALLQAVVAQSPVAMAAAKPDGALLIFNEACRRILGIEDELDLQLGSNLFEFRQTWRDYDPDGRLLPVRDLPLALALQGQYTKGMELRVVRKDGTERWEIVHGAPVYDADGVLIAGFVAFPDITERKRAEEALRESEERFRTLVQTAPCVILCLSTDGKITEFNPEAERLYGFKRDGVMGRDYLELCIPDDERRAVAADIAKVLGGQPTTGFENRVTADDGTERVLIWNASQRFDAAGTVSGIVCTGQDITDRKRAEQELARYRDHLEELVDQRTREMETAREQARQADRLASMGTFAAGMAHEINNPLGIMMLGTDQALANVDKPETITRLLQQNVEMIQRCGHIVRRVLDFSRKKSTGKQTLNLNEVVGRGVEFVGESAARHGVAIENRLATTLSPIRGNEVELAQVVVNLVQNAIQACTAGGHVTIETGEADEEIRLTVRDDGCGMSPEQMRHVFDPFYTTRLTRGGTGLGLSVVHGIIADHQGTITVASEEGRGTTFNVVFRRQEAEETANNAVYGR